MPKTETELTEIRRNFGTKNAINANVGQMNIGELVYITDFFPTADGNYILKVQNGVLSFAIGSFEPDEYLKTASVSGNTLTLTKKDGTTVTFTGEPSAFIKDASVSGNTLTLTKKDNSTVTFSKPSVINNLTSTSTTDVLFARPNETFFLTVIFGKIA